MPDWSKLSPRRLSTKVRTVIVLTLAVCVPLIVALIALGRIHWSPVLDLAMTELRVRDVGGRHTPLIGLPGRIGTFPDQGSHPGPLSFYLLAPTYRALGSTSWSLELGTVLIHVAAVAAALVLAFRRGGRRMCIAMAALLAVLLHGYGANVLTQPWNPYLPVLAWMVVLLAVWSLLEGDAVALLYFVVAGSLCAQTHVPYVALVGGFGALTLIWLIVRANVRRLHADVPMPGLRKWSIVSVVVGVVLWLPPVADQIRHTPGNLSMLSDYFRNPPEKSIGAGSGVRLLLGHFNLVRLATDAFHNRDFFKSTAFALPVSVLPGVLVLVLWLACFVVAVRMRHRSLVHLHAVIATGLVLALAAMIRIFGKVWYYLTFWCWGLVMLTLFAMIWTVVEAFRRRSPELRASLTRGVEYASIGVLVLSSLSFVWSAAHLKPPENYLSEPLGAVADPTAQALDNGIGGATGHDGRYLVTWSDVAYFGSQGYGLVNELERRGFDVGGTETFHVPLTPQRVVPAEQATAEIHLATGSYIDEWRNKPDFTEVAFTDPRSPAEQDRYDTMRSEVHQQLLDLGLDDLAAQLDNNLFGVQLDPRVPASVNTIIDQMLQLGQPTAVFVGPAGTD